MIMQSNTTIMYDGSTFVDVSNLKCLLPRGPWEFSEQQLAYTNGAIRNLDKMMADDPKDIAPYYNKALMHLSIFEFTQGWPLFKTRFNVPGCRYSYDFFPVKQWNGDDIIGKRLLVWTDQGIGDMIMCMSMLPDLAKLAGHVSVILPRRLVDIARRSMPNIYFYKLGEPMPDSMRDFDFDYQLSMGDIGQITRNSIADFPQEPFLKPDAAIVEQLRGVYSKLAPNIIGVAWESQSKVSGDEKSMFIGDLAPVLSQPDCAFINLQYDYHPNALKYAAEQGWNFITDESIDQLFDMDLFAAQVAACDMVVSVSSSLVHVAGALGVPTCVILPAGKGCHWYWTGELSKCIWYPSLELFRQTVIGDWTYPVLQAAQVVREVACRKNAA